MKIKQREPTKKLDDRITDVLNAISALEEMPGYPKSEETLNFTARILAKFMETVEVHHYDPEDPGWKGALGWVNPLLYTRDVVAETCAFFPPPIRWREIYGHWFTTLDGKRATDLLELIGE